MNETSTALQPRDPHWQEKVRASFAQQSFMTLLGARLSRLEPGRCEIELAWRADLLQQVGHIHAGAIASIADTASGYAAFTLMAAGDEVLTTEFKIHLLAPARGEALVARARVERAGRTLSVVACDVYARAGESEVRVALFVGTMMAIAPRG